MFTLRGSKKGDVLLEDFSHINAFSFLAYRECFFYDITSLPEKYNGEPREAKQRVCQLQAKENSRMRLR